MIYHEKDKLAEALKNGLMEQKDRSADDLESEIEALISTVEKGGNPNDEAKLKSLLADYDAAIKKLGKSSKFNEDAPTPAHDRLIEHRQSIAKENREVANKVSNF